MLGRGIRCGLGLFIVYSFLATDLIAQDRVFARDSSVSIALPSSFIPAPLNESAVLQFADTVSGAFILVVLDSKDYLAGWNLTRHSLVTAAQMVSSLDLPEVTGPVSMQIGSNSAAQYQILGSAQGTRITYLHTSIESPYSYAMVLAWTTGSLWQRAEQSLKDLTASIELHAYPGTIPFDIRTLIPGTWAWDRGPDACAGPTQRFELSADGKTMKIHHSEPIASASGKETSVTDYVVEGGDAGVLHTYIPGETRLDDNGAPVKWDLVLVGRNRIAWHRADWPEGGLTAMLKPCSSANPRPGV